jgi:hypothetical protein
MTDTALLLKEVEGLLPDYTAQFADFIDQLKRKAFPQKAVEASPSQKMFDEVACSIGYKDHLDYLRANTSATLEEAEADAERKFNDPNRKSIYEFYGCLKGEDCYGDGMEYQKMMRNEWPD